MDFTNNKASYGGSVGNTFFGIITNNGGNKTNFANLFYGIAGQSQLGNYSGNIDNTVNHQVAGKFQAEDISSTSRSVVWNGIDNIDYSGALLLAASVSTISVPQTSEFVDKNVPETVEKLEVKTYPNPSSGVFNLKLKAPQLNQEVVIRIVDLSGKVLQQVKGTPDKVFQVGEGLLPGTYHAEVMQGKEKVTVKLIRQ